MADRYFTIFLVVCLFPAAGMAQSDSYDLNLYPDVWYNSVDGVRIGGFVLGEMGGEFQSGPHRLDAGIWLGTNLPDLPVSYYISFTEPIRMISKYGEEGSIRVISSVRTGYSQHAISLNKRWQNDFDENRYRELYVGLSQEKMFNGDYRLNDFAWEQDWKTLLITGLETKGVTPLGKLHSNFSFTQNLNSKSGSFSVGRAEIKHITKLNKGFEINLRMFGLLSSDTTPREYALSLSNREPVYWLNNGVSRAKGTIPSGLIENGLIQIAGGMNLRGYNNSFLQMNNVKDHSFSYVPIFDKGFSFNGEFVFPNIINFGFRKSVFGDFIHFKSYLFYDVGTYGKENIFISDYPSTINETSADAGVGFQFSINIPTYLGKDRGFAIRYEMPLWLSDPDIFNDINFIPTGKREPNFKFRQLIGIGAVISL